MGLSARKAEGEIVKALSSRYELADGSGIETFAGDVVRAQILADANALLRFLGQKNVADLVGAQAALASASAIEGAAITRPSLAEVASQ